MKRACAVWGFYSILILILLPLANSCKEDDHNSIPISMSGVYVAGLEMEAAMASYLKNGTKTILGKTSHAASVVTSGTDVYVAGWDKNGLNTVAKYWKNGIGVNLTNGTNDGRATSIAIHGSDVYVAGWDGNVAKYWKNGTAVTIDFAGCCSYYYFVPYTPLSIAVSGTDVYVALNIHFNKPGVNPSVAAYWKDGLLTMLEDPFDQTTESQAAAIVVSGTDIYVAGWKKDGFQPNAAYWKNGTLVKHNLIAGTFSNKATSITISGNDVYLAGSAQIDGGQNGSTQHAAFWKNSDATILQDGSNLTSIFVSENDVYLAGSQGNVAKYWKNGTSISSSDGSTEAETSAITVSGADIIVTLNEQPFMTGKYWKDGVSVVVADGAKTNPKITSIVISGEDVYLTGSEGAVAKYWKNGTPTNLTYDPNVGTANAIAVSGSDVYVAGHFNFQGIYWKNGTPVPVTLRESLNQAQATSITLSGTDVYVTTEERKTSAPRYDLVYVTKYWKNDASVDLANGSSYSFPASIAVLGSDVYVAGTLGTQATLWKNGIAEKLTNHFASQAISIAISGTDIYVAGSVQLQTNGIWQAKYWKNGVEVDLPKGSNPTYATGIFVSDDDVYVSGKEELKKGHLIAVYWKNGNAVELTDASSTSLATSIYVVK